MFCITDSGVLKSPNIIVELCFSFQFFEKLFLLHWDSVLGVICDYICCIFLMNWPFCQYIMSSFVSCNRILLFLLFYLKSIFFDTHIAPSSLWLQVVWNVFCNSFPFSWFVALELHCVSFKQLRPLFLIRPANPFD